MPPSPSLPLFLAAAVRRAAAAVVAAAADDGGAAPGSITVDVASAPDGGVLLTIADSGVALSDAPPPPPKSRRRRRARDGDDNEAESLAAATAAAASLLAPAAAAALDPRALTFATAASSESAWRTYGARCVAGGVEGAVAVHAAPPLAKAPAESGGTRVAARVAPDVTAGAAAAAAVAALDTVAPALPPGTRLAVTGMAGVPLPPPPLPLDFATAVRLWASPPAPAALTIATGTVSPDAAGRRSGNGPAGYSARAAVAVGATRFAQPAAADAPPSATLVVTVDGGAVAALPPLSALRAAPWARHGFGVSAIHPAATPGVGRVTFTPASVLAGSVPSLIVLAFTAAPAALTAAVSAGTTLTPTAAAARRLAAAALAAALTDLKRSVPPDHLLPTGERALLGALPLVATALAGVAARAAVDSAVAAAVAGVVQAVGGAATPHDALLAALVDAVDAERAAGENEEEEDAAAAHRRASRPLAVEEVASDDGGDGGDGMWAPLASEVEW